MQVPEQRHFWANDQVGHTTNYCLCPEISLLDFAFAEKRDDAVVYMRKSERRAAIVEAAADMIWTVGLEAVTLRGVATHLGWSQGHVHHQFATLDELRAEAFTEVWRRIAPMYELDESASFEDRIAALLTGGAPGDIAILSDRVWRDALAAARMHPSVKAVLRDAVKEWLQALVTALERGAQEGDLPPGINIHQLAERLMSATLGQDILADVLLVENTTARQAESIKKILSIEIAAAKLSFHFAEHQE